MASRTRIRRRAAKRTRAAKVRRCACQGAQTARADAKGKMEGSGGVLIGGAHDPAEKAADRMAAQALSGGPVSASSAGGGAVHRECAKCAEEKEAKRDASPGATVASGAGSARASASASNAINGLGAGRPLARSERAFFEPRFGRDFSNVRVHEDSAADKAANAIDARAFAYGDDIAFAKGERAKGGDRLMAHELAHVTQEDGGARRTVRRSCHDGNCETCADGKKTLDLTFYFRTKATKKTMKAIKDDVKASRKILKNCCLNVREHYDWTLQKGPATKAAPPNRTTGPHAGDVDYDADTEKLGGGKTFKKAKGVPVMVLDEVTGSGGGMTVHKGADALYAGVPFIFFAVKDTNPTCPTIAHELWHMGGKFNHDGTKGGIVDCSSHSVSADYCSAVRALAT